MDVGSRRLFLYVWKINRDGDGGGDVCVSGWGG